MDFDLRDNYQVGGGLLFALITLFIVLWSGLTGVILLLGALSVGAGYWWWWGPDVGTTTDTDNADEDTTATGDTLEASSSSHRKTTGKKRNWKVVIGADHTPSSSATEMSLRSGRRSLLLTPTTTSSGGRGGPDPLSSPHSLLGSPAVSPAAAGRRASTRLSAVSSPGAGLPLPRVRRIRAGSQSDGGSMAYSPSRGMRSPQVPSTGVLSPQVPSPSRRYPTHQPQYAGLGLMPPVHLQRPERHLLSDRNTSMLTSPITVKIAPPDVLKPPVPSIVPVQAQPEPDSSTAQNPCDTQSVLTAIREKRKRTIKDDEEVTPTVETRVSKRRKQVISPAPVSPAPSKIMTQHKALDTSGSLVTDTRPLATGSLKRPAISPSRAASISEMEDSPLVTKRSRSAGPPVSFPTATPGSTGRTRNPIEVSYSSSKRWLEKKNQADTSLTEGPSSKKRVTRSQSREPSTQRGTDHDVSSTSDLRVDTGPMSRLSPRRILSLVDQDTPMKDESKAQEKPEKQETAPSSSTASEDLVPETPDLSDPTTKRKLFPLARDSSSRRRHTQIRSDSNAEFSKVPTLRYTLTSEDYEKDRASEMKRVEQMLDDVEEAHAAKTAAKSAKEVPTSTPALTVSVSTVSTSAPVKTNAAPSSTLTLPKLGTGPSTSFTSTGAKPALLPTPIAPLTVGSSATPKVTSSQSAASPPPASVTTVTSLSTPLLQTGQASAGLTKPSSTMVDTVLFKHSPVTAATSAAAPGVVSAASGLVSSGTATSTAANSSQPTPSTKYSFPPVFGSTNPSAASSTHSFNSTAATAAAPSMGSFSGTKPSVSLGTSVPSTLVSAAAATTSFTLGGMVPKPASGQSVASSTGFSFGTAPTTTAPSAGGFGLAKTTAATSATGAAPSFSFGTANAATTATTPAAFGSTSAGSVTTSTPFGANTQTATASTKPFGTASSLTSTPAFGGPTSTPFGTSTVTASSAAPGFNFGTASQTSAKPAFGTTDTKTASKPIIFGQAPTTTAGVGSAFGQTAPSTITFGQAASTTPATSVSVFGGTASKPVSVPGGFGNQPTGGQTVNSGFQFGTTPSQAATTSTASTFAFGGAKTTAGGQTAAPFAFGAATSTTAKLSSGGMTFGQASSTVTSSGLPKPNLPAPAFGTTTTNNAFGSTSTNAFGSGMAFGNTNPAPAFGQAANTQNAFGTSSTTSNAFGSSSASQPGAFGTGTGSVFGGGQQQATSGFGAPTSTQPSKGFDFSASSKPTINFGGAGPSTQQPAPQGSFNFGAANTQSQGGGFNFNAGSSPAFGMTAPGTPQMRGPAPAFGTPTATPTGPQNPFTPGGFTVGSGNTQPRPRTTVRAARRRTNKR